MRMYDVIQKKRDKLPLSDAEIRFAVEGFAGGAIPDYQMAALLMAIYFNGLDERELYSLTAAMAESGESVDLGKLGDRTVDKHSTGGVGDKTTLIVAPVVASLGGVVAKMSGRGLGYTGGTADKLESIPGYRISLTREEFIRQAESVGVAVIGQSESLAPADKKIYALRDVTATVDSVPLIASSVMSKKLASGSRNIVLDVKAGSGAFMKTPEAARELAETMVKIGKSAGRRMSALITDMDSPLGCAVGNALEVLEAVDVLSGRGPRDLEELCIELAARMISLFSGWTYDESLSRAAGALRDGSALGKFREWIKAQGGNVDFIENPSAIWRPRVKYVYKSPSDGYIARIDTELVGKAAMALGAGREKSGDSIDHSAGILLRRKRGDLCARGDEIASLYASDERRIEQALGYLGRAFEFSQKKPDERPIVLGAVE